MPQFDPAVFAPQLIWLAIFFVALYVLMARLALPRVDQVLALRRERIEGNLAKAEIFKEEASKVLAAYQKAIADAKEAAQAELAKASAEIGAVAARRESELAQALAAKTAAAEAAIKAAKEEAMREAARIAAGLANAMAGKLAGLTADSAQAEAAVRVEQSRRGG